jgi:hypothetical protein
MSAFVAFRQAIERSRRSLGKQFFSEEKNQKTLIPFAASLSAPRPQRIKSLLLLFFRKEDLS